MSKTSSIRIVHIGRNARVRERLAGCFVHQPVLSVDGFDGEQFRLEFLAVSNQKAALGTMRTKPPSIVMIETDGADSRLRFCEMVRYRFPTATILSVGRFQPQGTFVFDGHVALPAEQQQLMQLIRHICVEGGDYRLELGNIHLNVATRTVVTPNGRYRMTPKQCALLRELMLNHGQVVTRERLMEAIWQTKFMDDTRTLDVHIRWLRERIEHDPSEPDYLMTVRGVGYMLALP